jgi:hypothetical protein
MVIILLFLSTICSAESFTITQKSGFAILKSVSNDTCGILYWSDSATSDGLNKTIDYTYYDTSIFIKSFCNANKTLSSPISLGPSNQSPCIFKVKKAWIRFFVDSLFLKVNDIPDGRLDLVRYKSQTEFIIDTLNRKTESNSFVEFYTDSLVFGNKLFPIARHIILDTVVQNASPSLEELGIPLIVPAGRKAVLRGMQFDGMIQVNGSIDVKGTPLIPVSCKGIVLSGKKDTTFSPARVSNYLEHVNAASITGSFSNSILNFCSAPSLSFDNFSSVKLTHATLTRLTSDHCKLLIDSSGFSPDEGYVTIANSIVTFTACNYSPGQSAFENQISSSYVRFENNEITPRGIHEMILPRECLVEFINNRILRIYDMVPHMEAFQNTYFIFRNNLIKDYGIDIGYSNTCLLYNNTFIHSEVSTYGMGNKIKSYNNIFWESSFTLNPSSLSNDTIKLWTDNNLVRHVDTACFPSILCLSHARDYVYSDTNYSKVYGNTRTLVCDPLFKDTVSYKLSQNSPAIDSGIKKIPAFSIRFTVLDSLFSRDSGITITNFIGSSPDIGAYEFGETSPISSNIKSFKHSDGKFTVHISNHILKITSPFLTDEPLTISFYSSSGKLKDKTCFRLNNSHNATVGMGSSWAAGIYFYAIACKGNNFHGKLFLK